jgi:hypothetical protein
LESKGKRFSGIRKEVLIKKLPDVNRFLKQKERHKLEKYSKEAVEEAMKGEMPSKFLRQLVRRENLIGIDNLMNSDFRLFMCNRPIYKICDRL